MRNKKRSFFYYILPLIIYFGINFAVSVAVVVFAQLKIMGQQNIQSAEMFYELVYEEVYRSQLLLMLITGIVSIIVFVLMFILHDRKYHDALFVNRLGVKDIISALIIGAACYVVTDTLITVLSPFLSELIEQSNDMINSYLSDTWLSIFIVGIIAPVSEELLFRGLIFNRLRENRSVISAVIASGIIFGAMHIPNALQMVYAGLLGVVMAWAYYKYENILIPIIIHLTFNLMNYIPLGALVSTKAGLGIYCLVVVLLSSAAFKILKNRPHAPQKVMASCEKDNNLSEL